MNKAHNITFLSYDNSFYDDKGNVRVRFRYWCSNNHLFYVDERAERKNANYRNEITNLKKKVQELEEIIQNNIAPSAPPLAEAVYISDHKDFMYWFTL